MPLANVTANYIPRLFRLANGIDPNVTIKVVGDTVQLNSAGWTHSLPLGQLFDEDMFLEELADNLG